MLVAFRTDLRSLEAHNDTEHRSVASPVWSVRVGTQWEQASSTLDAFSEAKRYIPLGTLRLLLTIAGPFGEVKTVTSGRFPEHREILETPAQGS